MASNLKFNVISNSSNTILTGNSISFQLNCLREKQHSQYLKVKEQKKSKDNKQKCFQALLLKKDQKALQDNRWLVDWSLQEDEILFKKYLELGSKWSDLTNFLPNKSDNAIKNRFNCCMRKVQRKMNKVQKEKKIKHRKLIKYQTLLTFLQIGKVNCLQFDKRLINAAKNIEQIVEVRDIIIKQAKKQEDEIKDKDIQSLILRFLEVKYSLKFMNAKRVKKCSKSGFLNIDRQSTVQASFLSQESNVQEFKIIQQNERRGSNSFLDFQIMKSDYFDDVKEQKTKNLIEDCQMILNFDPQQQKFDYQFFMRS